MGNRECGKHYTELYETTTIDWHLQQLPTLQFAYSLTDAISYGYMLTY